MALPVVITPYNQIGQVASSPFHWSHRSSLYSCPSKLLNGVGRGKSSLSRHHSLSSGKTGVTPCLTYDQLNEQFHLARSACEEAQEEQIWLRDKLTEVEKEQV